MTANVLFATDFQVIKGMEKQTMQFIEKLRDNPSNPSLKVKPLKNAVDSRVRTARVTDQYRAVLIEFDGADQRHFMLKRIDNHDDANEYAAKLRFRRNPVNGVIDFIEDSPEIDTAAIEAEIEARAQQLAAEKLAKLQTEQQATEAVITGTAVADARSDNAAGSNNEAADVGNVAVVETPETPPRVTLTNNKIDESLLAEKLGLSKVSIGATWRAESEEDLEALLAESSTWEKDAIIGLLAGMSINEVKEDLGLDSVEAEDSMDLDEMADEEIVEQLKERGLAFEPSEQELQDMWEKGSFQQWRVFLHHSQRKAAFGNHKGSARIVGGAGTGKTVVLVHRAEYLLEKYPHSKILLTTFTRGLANQLKTLMSTLDPSFPEAVQHGAPGLWISGIDALIYAVLHNAQKAEISNALESALGIRGSAAPQAIDARLERQLWQEAAELHGEGLHPTKLQPEFLSGELIDIILTNSITEEKDYLRVSRQGRGTSLNRAERKKVWAICRSFLRSCEIEKRLPFPALAVVGAEVLEKRAVAMFDHVLIDEAQDFHAGHWRFLRAAVAKGSDDIFLAEDSHQRIYGRRTPLRNFGIETRGGATKRLLVNYRTTAQNLAYATAILEGGEWIDSESDIDFLVGYRSLANGPAPIIATVQNKADELELLATTVKKWLQDNSPSMHIGILTRDNHRAEEINKFLKDDGVESSNDRSGAVTLENQVSVMTMHNAKGMEFTNVILTDMSAGVFPKTSRFNSLAQAEQYDALLRERALLYVAASRARDQLMIVVTGEPSELLPELNERSR